MIDGKVEEFLRAVKESSRSVLLLDYDGTLAPFAVQRQQAVPYEGLVSLLEQIADTGRTRIVVVTGRNAREVGPLLGLRSALEVWGAHGLQRLRPDGSSEMPEVAPRAMQALDDARRWLAYQGLQDIGEAKPGSIAVHWRALEEAAASKLRGRVLLGWFPIAERGRLKLLEFDGGVEMRMPDLDKGDAVRIILSEEDPGVPIAYLGDDATDEHAFRALGHHGLTVLVRTKQRRTSAQVWMKPPGELLEFLARWIEATQTARLTQSASYS